MADTPDDDALSDALAQLPPASESVGVPGHDDALEQARGIALLRDKALGLTYEEIAARHGYGDRSGARRALLRAVDRHEAESVRELRVVENARYELDQRTLRAIIADPDKDDATRLRAIDTRTRSQAQNARLNGTMAPVTVEISAGVQQQLDAGLNALREALYGPAVVPGEATDVIDERAEG